MILPQKAVSSIMGKGHVMNTELLVLEKVSHFLKKTMSVIY